MCESSNITKIISLCITVLMISLPMIYVMIYINKAKKSRKKKKRYGKAFIIAIIMFIVLFLLKMLISLTGNNCVNCYINNKCNESITTTKEVSTIKTTKEETTETTTTATTVSITSETVTTSKKTTTASSPFDYGKVSEVSGTKKEVGVSTNGYSIYEIDGITYIDGYLIANKTYSLPKNYVPTDTYRSASGQKYCQDCINNTVWKAWKKMQADASAAGIKLYIGSGYRSYEGQNGLYQKYVNRDGKEKADTYSARPGSSEHQTALCFDLCGTNLSSDKCISSGFDSTNEAKWLDQNAHLYGFIIRYPKGKTDETGYKYESWHLRYVGKELAGKLYNNGNWITMESYFGITSKYND